MKKLIPALVLLLVSAMVLSTSSYAWFSMNRTVQATGMSLTSTAPANLLISNSSKTVWGANTISNEVYAGKIFPASSADGTVFFALADGQKIGEGDIGGIVAGTGAPVTDGVKFYKGSNIAGSEVVKLATGEDDTATGYWVEYTLYLKTTGASLLNVYLSAINITSTYTAVALPDDIDFEVPANQIYYVRSGDAPNYIYTLQESGLSSAGTYYTKNTIDDTVRVAIFKVVEDVETLVGIYDAGATKDTVNPISAVVYNDDDFVSYTASDSDAAKITGVDADGFVSTDRTFTVAGNEVETKLLVRVWIEGQNAKCINNIAGQNFNIGLTFNIKADA